MRVVPVGITFPNPAITAVDVKFSLLVLRDLRPRLDRIGLGLVHATGSGRTSLLHCPSTRWTPNYVLTLLRHGSDLHQ